MSENKKSCPLGGFFKKIPCELKLVYLLIIILFLCNIFTLFKLYSGKTFAKWIDNNPKAILDSVQKYAEAEQAKAQQQQQQQTAEAVKNNKEAIFNEKNSGVANKKGTQVIVEFFDYNCGYCKMASKVVDKMAREDKNIKVIFRELPIFGGTSDLAARYSTAVAIEYPDKYLDFHSTLMESGARSEKDIENALKTADISLFKIKKVMENKKSLIDSVLQENRDLAFNKLGLQGTPAFVIGETLVPGFIEEATIRSLLESAK